MRRTELDLCRITACISVILIHTVSGSFSFTDHFSAAMFLASALRGAVPLFFMISGILFLRREELDLKKTVLPRALRLTALVGHLSAGEARRGAGQHRR